MRLISSGPRKTEQPAIRMKVTCSKGTYIRTLAEDIGEALGCGAHLLRCGVSRPVVLMWRSGDAGGPGGHDGRRDD